MSSPIGCFCATNIRLSMKIRPFKTTSDILTQQQISTVGLPLVKWLLALPHYVVLFALSITSLVCIVIA